METTAHDARPETKLPVVVHLPLLALLLLAALALVTMAGAASAATVRIGIDGGASQTPPLADACSANCTLEVYVDLDDASVSPDDREASVFQMDFDVVKTGAWGVSLDLGAVDPGVDPLGVGSWPDAVGNLTTSRVSVSLTSDNSGGERLVLQLQLVPPATPDAGDELSLYLTGDPARIIVARDDGGSVMPVSLTDPAPASPIAVVPEPTAIPMLVAGAAGLAGLAALRHRRRA